MTEPKVKLLVELCAVLGGKFTMHTMKELWSLSEGGDDEDLNNALMVAIKKKVLTSMSSKGYAPVGRNRKSSIGENVVFAFVHLRILDVCSGMLLKQQKVQLHAMCAEAFSSDGMQTEPEARHLNESEEYERAVAYWRQAIDLSRKSAGDFLPFIDSSFRHSSGWSKTDRFRMALSF